MASSWAASVSAPPFPGAGELTERIQFAFRACAYMVALIRNACSNVAADLFLRYMLILLFIPLHVLVSALIRVHCFAGGCSHPTSLMVVTSLLDDCEDVHLSLLSELCCATAEAHYPFPHQAPFTGLHKSSHLVVPLLGYTVVL